MRALLARWRLTRRAALGCLGIVATSLATTTAMNATADQHEHATALRAAATEVTALDSSPSTRARAELPETLTPARAAESVEPIADRAGVRWDTMETDAAVTTDPPTPLGNLSHSRTDVTVTADLTSPDAITDIVDATRAARPLTSIAELRVTDGPGSRATATIVFAVHSAASTT